MPNLVRDLGHSKRPEDFDFIKISIASPERIRSWSYGEVKKPETINYRTYKPERDGLFCARIFGPVKDYECLCGKYKRIKYRGIICEKCGVEVTLSTVRRDRMGHIELVSPVTHIWFTKSLPSRIAVLLDLMMKDLDNILYFEKFVVIDPGLTSLKKHQLLTEEQLSEAQDEHGPEAFIVNIGSEALKIMLSNLDLPKESVDLRSELLTTNSEMRRKKIVKRLTVIEAFLNSKADPSWMVMDVIPVIPPELRPLVPLDGGRFATSDLNDLYRRVINRNNRLKRLIDLRAPDIIVRNEKRMLQESVDALFDNGRRNRPIAGANKRPLKSLADMLKGKQGRFRQNLLGKRVDYSGRSVIVVGPQLKLHQCGIPKPMALELFKPYVLERLVRYGMARTIKMSKRAVEKKRPEVWDILEDVIREHPVLLNRAPTLHRLGIQAFEPCLVEGKAIQLHPLVCTAFNADFDGDQMAVHVPLSIEAQLEARVLMMSTNNILHPASGRPIIVPTKDMVLGLYYLTMVAEGVPGEGMIFGSIGEIEQALLHKIVGLHAKIKARYHGVDENGSSKVFLVETTPGRMILSEIFPRHPKIPFSFLNTVLDSKEISKLLDVVYRHCGQKEAVIFADRLMANGFKYATLSGVSFGKDDLVVPPEKEKWVAETQAKVQEYTQQYKDGLITPGERYNRVIDIWHRCGEEVANAMMKGIAGVEPGKPLNSVYMMAHSGARGAPAQIRQLAGMRGLMAKPSGEIIEDPIISNFKEGLTVIEFFNSTHGGRKGMSDTALKTANSGYLTRRVVDVGQDSFITIEECGTQKGIVVRPVVEGSEILTSLPERLLGRTVAEDLINPQTSEVIVPKGEIVTEASLGPIEESGIDRALVRSPLTCEAKEGGICASCYGRDLARGTRINVGEAVGVIAAQSIGEPGTQLTMRTFHIGGAAQKAGEESHIDAPVDGVVILENRDLVMNSEGVFIMMGRYCELVLKDARNRDCARYKIPYGAKLFVDDGDKVTKGQRLSEWDPYTTPIISESEGIVAFVDLVDGMSVREVTDETTGISSRVVLDWRQQTRGGDLRPRISLRTEQGDPVILPSSGGEARYLLPVDAIITIENDSKVSAGDVIARLPRASSKTRDITGGLPRVAELFEARMPKDYAVISEIDGRVEFGKDYKSKRRIRVIPNDESLAPIEYLVPKGRHAVFEGEQVKKGDLLIDGNPVPHDILRVLGVEALAGYLINEIQEVYRLQGVPINDKHIEVIVRQMLQKVEIDDPGDTMHLVGEQVDARSLEEENLKLESQGLRPARSHAVLQGITKASLQTRSFFSAASFQDTTRVLTEAAVEGKVDDLVGLKENIIVGRLIPVGTGGIIRKIRSIASSLDQQKLEQTAASATLLPSSDFTTGVGG